MMKGFSPMYTPLMSDESRLNIYWTSTRLKIYYVVMPTAHSVNSIIYCSISTVVN